MSKNKTWFVMIFMILVVLVVLFSGIVSAVECKNYYYSTSNKGNEIHCVADDGITYQVEKKDVGGTDKFVIKTDNKGAPVQSPAIIDLIPIDFKDLPNVAAGETPDRSLPETSAEPETPPQDYNVHPWKEPGVNTATFMYDYDKNPKTPPQLYKFKNGGYYRCKDTIGSSCDIDPEDPDKSWEKVKDEDLKDTFNEDQKLQDGLISSLGFLGKFSLPLELSWMEAKGVGQGFFALGKDLGLWEDDWIDDFMGVNDLLATEFGQYSALDFGDSICRYSSDYDSLAAGGGVLMPPGATSPSAWITGEAQEVQHPSLKNSNDIIKEYTYRISFSVSPNGITKNTFQSGLLGGTITNSDSEDAECDDKLSFTITAGNSHVDENADGIADLIELGCDDSYSRTGVSALIITSEQIFSKVCIHFEDTSDIHDAIIDILDDGDKVCNDVNFQNAGCPYCGLTAEDLEGIDMGPAAPEESEESEEPAEPAEPAGPPQFI